MVGNIFIEEKLFFCRARRKRPSEFAWAPLGLVFIRSLVDLHGFFSLYIRHWIILLSKLEGQKNGENDYSTWNQFFWFKFIAFSELYELLTRCIEQMYWPKDFIVLLWSVRCRKIKKKSLTHKSIGTLNLYVVRFIELFTYFSSCSRRFNRKLYFWNRYFLAVFPCFGTDVKDWIALKTSNMYRCLKLGIISAQYDRYACSFAFLIETQHWTAAHDLEVVWTLLAYDYSQNAEVIFQNGLDISHLELKALKPGNWINK